MSPNADPAGPELGTLGVVRGGAFACPPRYTRCAERRGRGRRLIHGFPPYHLLTFRSSVSATQLTERATTWKSRTRIYHALVWPIIAHIGIILFRKPIIAILHRLKGADLPGGVSLNFEQEIREAKDLFREAKTAQLEKGISSVSITDANARPLSLGLQPSPSGLDFKYYHALAEQEPNLALAGLRMEIQTWDEISQM